jgi:hypothetical protein
MNASDVGSAPTSSSAIAQPRERIRSTVCSSSAGDLDDDAQLAGRAARDLEQLRARRGVEDLRLDVDEHRERRQHALGDRRAERLPATAVVELGEAALGARCREERGRALERAPGGTADERLVADDRPCVEVDDRLEHAPQAIAGDQ